jgi:acyl-CoA thioester hydrolase
MARVRLELPETFPFSTEIQIQIGDINYGGHVGNDAVLRLMHEARIRFLAHRGLSELDMGGLGLIVADAVVVYRSEGFHGDRLNAEVATGDWNRNGCDFFYRLNHAESGREIARGKTGIVLFDYGQRKVARVPDLVRERLAGTA